ncbi:MAG: pitrilysin family protein [Candidatus Gastranaerophilales bacterium]|nr:pitrilysin family protein [Candidatus Gastranaerophilales bacterium]
MKKLLVFLFVFVLGSAVFAQDYYFYKLDNGQTVIIKQVKNNPIVTIDTWIKTGSINENEQNNGVSHFLEHLFFKGTKTHPPGEIDRILEAKGAQTNAATSKDFTHYYIVIPSKYFDLAMDLHSDMLLNPLIPRKELEKERKVVMEEIAKDANNPEEKVYENLIQMLYTTHPYKRKVIGTNEIVGKITREEILSYYNTHYGPQNMVTIVVGDVEPQHALNKIIEGFRTEPRKIIKNNNKPEKQLCTKQVKIDYQPVQGGYLLIGYRSVNAVDADVYALDVLAAILGEGRSSVFYQTVKEQKQLAYSISANNATFREDGIFTIDANFVPGNQDKLEKAIIEEISKIQKNGVTPEQLKIAQSIIERNTYYDRESTSNIASEMGYTMVLTDNPKYYDEYLNNIQKVTVYDIKKVANTYLDENKSAVSIVLPERENKVLSDIKPGAEHSAKLIKEIPSTKKYELDNGVTLLVSPNDLNDIIAMSIYVKGGEFSEKIPGTADIMSSTMLKGTKTYSAVELAKILEENGIKISPSASADDFSIDVLTTKSQLSKTFEILDEVINRVSFDEYEIEKVKTAKLKMIEKSRDVPINLALEEYKNLIFENSVYSYGSKIFEKTLPKIQRDDIWEYYNKIFNPKNIIISINGNVDTNDFINQFSEIFGDKNQKDAVFNYNDYASKIYPLIAPKTSTKEIKDLKTAWLILGWQAAGVQNQKDCVTLQVIDAVLGSGMSSRLFKNIRDKEGLAYQLGSGYSPKILKGAFTLYIGTNPKTLNLAKEKMLAEVNRLKKEFVSDKELQEAKDKIIGNYILSQETNLDKASTLNWFEASGRGFDFKDKYEKLVNSVTASDIIEVANKYFNENYVTSIVKGIEGKK